MKEVGLFEAKTHLSALVRQVEETHECIIIQRRGKDVAKLVPCHEAADKGLKERMDLVIEEFREIRESQLRRGFKPLKGDEIKSFITEGRKR